ncbi:PilC/PilY family type IV pilus protein [Candidatus Halobeggiatoa sp. HSG11]|nr:PilC/PilY family type IV pilus protein [Candidatus Halobeggiatoa sp. HSG11]
MINLRTLLISILIVILPGLSISSFADDTEIYSRKTEVVSTSEGSNILFMLDNSGSMNLTITDKDGNPSGQRRIDVLKEALDLMLDNATNVNVGLGRFAALIRNQPPVNAPIIFPVEFIDKDVSELKGEEQDSIGDITASIIQDSDDAEQFEKSGEMFLYETDLDMATKQNEVISYGGEQVNDRTVTTQSFVSDKQNDAEEFLNSDHTFYSGSDILYLGTRPSSVIPPLQANTNNIVALRFDAINIPPGSKVLEADIMFVSADSYGEITDFNVAIYGAANDGLYLKDPSGVHLGHSCFQNGVDAGTCSNGTTDGYLSGTGYTTPNFSYIEDDSDTVIKVLWNKVDALGTGQIFNSPSIKDIVQAIIDRDGWNDGTDQHHPHNSLVLLFKRDGTSPATDMNKSRSFYSADTFDKVPPKIRITWEKGGSPASIAKELNDLKFQRKDGDSPDTWRDNLYNAKIQLGRRCEGGPGTIGTDCKYKNEAIVGVRFPELDVPKDAEITSAKITFTHQNGIESTTTGRKNLNLFIHAENTINPRDFSSKNNGLLAEPNLCSTCPVRNRVDSSIEWNNVPPLPSVMAEDTSWDGTGSPPSGLKTIWEGDGDAPSGYCTMDENGMVTDSDCIKFTTPDLSSILQKIVARNDWKRESSVVFLFETNANNRNADESLPDSVGFRRIVAPTDPDSNMGGDIDSYTDTTTNNTTLPKLEVTYEIAFKEDIAEKQKIGLRFEAIDIPRGAKVESAYLVFTSSEDTSTSANMTIQAEAGSSEMFTEEPFNISNRTLTNASVDWSPNSWNNGLSYESPELKDVIQEVVDGSDWCSGNLTFVISSDDLTSIRKASSFDYMPGHAPELRVRFDTENIKPGGGCVNQTYYSKVSERFDDAEEKISGSEDGLVFLASPELEVGVRDGESRLVGFRFRELPIGNGAEVVGANLMLTSKKDMDNDATFQVYGELSTDPQEFSSEDFNLSSRSSTTTVEWKPGIWKKGRVYRTPNLSSIIQEIVDQPEWKAYNDIILLIKGSGRRDVISFDENQSLGASFRIQIKGKLGEDGQGDIVTVRRRLQTLVKRMRIPNSTTPIVGALFESAQYYLGKNVVNGRTRNNESFHLVSHPATHNSENNVPDGCNINMNPYAVECAGEEIVSSSAKYTPPNQSTSSCQSSHIVLLTDGRANVNDENARKQKSDVESLLSNTCVDTFTLGDKTIQISEDELCGIDLADYLASKKNIIVHTIGFQLGTAWLGRYLVDGTYVAGPKLGEYFDTTEFSTTISTIGKKGRYIGKSKLGSRIGKNIKDVDETVDNIKAVDYLCRLASPGTGNYSECSGRNFYLAGTVEELSTAFSSISAQATTTNSSFAAPSISVNNLNQLRHKNDVYYSVFRPGPEPRWHGNIKRYKYINGSLKDKYGAEATSEGHIADGTTSLWSDDEDGGNVTAGGLGEELVSGNRKVYTYFNTLHQIQNFESVTPGSPDEKLVDKLLLNYEASEEAESPEEEKAIKEAEANKLIKWILGKNVTEGEGSSTVDQSTETEQPVDDTEDPEPQNDIRIGEGDRWAFSDPLHSTPRIILYTGTKEEGEESEESSEVKEESRLFVGTNDGLIRMADVANGKEKWSFLPQILLDKQLGMRDQIGDQHAYGVDATPTFFINTSDGQIIPERGNFATMFASMRRGGRNIYAFDVSDKDGTPDLMWTIEGGKGDFTKLGQTWSAPLITEVNSSYCNYAWCRVVVFAGGYDTIVESESTFNPTKEVGMGNAIYMVDPETGELLWWAGGIGSGANLELPDMKYAIPSDVLLQDIDGDKYKITDRIYVGDIGGQLWRIDLNKDDSDPKKAGVMARLATANHPNKRSFFYPPALARLDGKNVLTAVTGARPNPLALGTGSGSQYYAHDQFYAILDNEINFDFTKPISLGNLADVTDWDSDIVNLKDTDKDGWYFSLQESSDEWIGEKGLGRPVVVDNEVFFITYVPPSFSSAKTVDGSCGKFNPGTSRFYAINLLDGGPSFEKNGEGEEATFDEKQRGDGSSDRSIDVSTLAFDPIVMYTDTSEEVVLAGQETAVRRPVPPARVFWLQK